MSYGPSVWLRIRTVNLQSMSVASSRARSPPTYLWCRRAKLDLVINIPTARALGLEIPPTLLARADEVIE